MRYTSRNHLGDKPKNRRRATPDQANKGQPQNPEKKDGQSKTQGVNPPREVLPNEMVEIVENFAINSNAEQICRGIVSMSDAEASRLEDDFRSSQVQDNVKRAIDNETSGLSNDLFRGSRFAPTLGEDPFDRIKRVENPHWLHTKALGSPEEMQKLDAQAKKIATLIEREQKRPTEEDEGAFLEKAEERVPIQTDRVKHSTIQSDSAFMSTMNLAWKHWDLQDQKRAGTISEEVYKTKSGEIAENIAQLGQTNSGSASAKALRAAQQQSFEAINKLIAAPEAQKKLHDLANSLRSGPLDSRKEEEALKLFSPAMRATYRSKSIDNAEKRQFWSQTAALTKNPLNKTSAMKLHALELGQVSRENAEHSVSNAEYHNTKTEKVLHEKRVKEKNEQKEKEQESRQRHQDRMAALKERTQTVKQNVDKTLHDMNDSLKMDIR